MRSKLCSAALAAAIAASLLTAAGAAAATEAGNECLGEDVGENVTTISLANGPGNPFPATIPVDGVITRWTYTVEPLEPIPPAFFTETLKVFRPTGVPGTFQVVGESTPAPISNGLNVSSTRIPVHAGDFFGSTGSTPTESHTIFCETGNPGDRLGLIGGNPTLGSSATIIDEEAKFQNPVVVSVEPDADNDGFGDETQDRCPQSAATQGPCPAVPSSAPSASSTPPPAPVTLDSLSLSGRRAVSVYVTTSVQASVHVSGTVKLGKGATAKLDGGTRAVAPGALAKFKLKLASKVVKSLKELPPSKKLTLNITAAATDSAGHTGSDTESVALKGQAKPARGK
jgi:hypothetical protein